MLLSAFSRSDMSSAFGLVVDHPDYFPREGVQSVGFIARMENGELAQDVIDTIISYKTVGIEVIVEVDDLGIEPAQLVPILQSLDVGLWLLPPAEATRFDAYLDAVQRFAAAVPAFPGYGRPIDPVAPTLLDAVIRRLKRTEEPVLDPVAGAVRRGFEDALGGPDAFVEYLDLHVAAIHEDGRRKVANYAENLRASAAAPAIEDDPGLR